MNGWRAERRKWQSELIRKWRPWEKSTGPRTLEGKAVSRNNALNGRTRSILRDLARVLRRLCGSRSAEITPILVPSLIGGPSPGWKRSVVTRPERVRVVADLRARCANGRIST
jgi:hypothetical protein